MTLDEPGGSAGSIPSTVVASDDRALVQRMQDGDSSAFAALYGRYVRVVFGYAGTVLQSFDDVEDVVQETFLTAWEKLRIETILDRSALPWLLTTARFKAYNRNRARTRRARNESGTPSDELNLSVAGAEELVIADDLRASLEEAINQLSQIDRTVFEICLIDGSTYSEAAQALEITTGAVRNRLARIRRRLRAEVEILKGQ